LRRSRFLERALDKGLLILDPVMIGVLRAGATKRKIFDLRWKE
jgi:hypothetical protein